MKRRQAGIALPIALIMFVVMLISALYIMRSTATATIATANLAYQRSIARAADVGLETAYTWLTTTAAASKVTLDNNSSANGYVASYPFVSANTPASYLDAVFWNGSATTTLTDAAGSSIVVEYVVHRFCAATGAAANTICVQTQGSAASGTGATIGASLAVDADDLIAPSLLHYVVTARISPTNNPTLKPSSIVVESVVMIGV
jgi:Tfp pilus assembly protein PilX